MYHYPYVLLLLAVFVSLAGGCSQEEPEVVERIRAIRTFTVQEKTTGHTNIFPGVVEAVNDTVLSFEVPGNIKEIRADVGDAVVKGQVLAVLDKQPFRLQVSGAVAELNSAQAAFAGRKKDLDRLRRIFDLDPGAVSRADLDAAKANYDSALSSIDYAKSQLALTRRDLQKAELSAPYTGSIAIKHVEEFQDVNRGQAVFDMYAKGAMQVAIRVSEIFRDTMKTGMVGDLSFPVDPTRIYKGVVSEVGSAAGEANTFPIKISIESPSPSILPGVAAEASLIIEKIVGDLDAYLVPLQAFVASNNKEVGAYVFVYDAQNSTVRKQAVQGVSFQENYAAITEGVQAGDILATAGVNYLRDGQKVRLMTTSPTEK
jgi:RND family efflux transporter MFP subunit